MREILVSREMVGAGEEEVVERFLIDSQADSRTDIIVLPSSCQPLG